MTGRRHQLALRFVFAGKEDDMQLSFLRTDIWPFLRDDVWSFIKNTVWPFMEKQWRLIVPLLVIVVGIFYPKPLFAVINGVVWYYAINKRWPP